VDRLICAWNPVLWLAAALCVAARALLVLTRTDRLPELEVTVRLDGLARSVGWLRRLPGSAVDVGLALIFVAAVGVERVLDPLDGAVTALTSAILTLVLAGSLALRRRYPLAAFVSGSLALCAESLLGVGSVVSPYANQIGAYSFGLYATRSRARWGPLIILAGVLAYFRDTIPTEAFAPIGVLFVWLATWAVGYSTARRREDQDRARRAIARQVVAEERTRMARELHDVVGHHVSVIGVLAAAAGRQLDRDPGKASAALNSIEDSSRQAVAEMHRLLGFLRQDDDAAEVAPPPKLRQLDVLTAQLGAANFSVDVRVEGEERPLPTSVELSAYRVVQEALTNIVKHAEGATTADVCVRYRPEEVEVEIVDDGQGQGAVRKKRVGHGLIGMRERVALHGGRLTAGRRPGGGYAVQAIFPLDRPS
jgi:signal transduction histidine kinase